MIEEQLEAIVHKYQELNELLSNPDVVKDQEKFRKYAKAHSDLESKVAMYREWQRLTEERKNAEEMLKDEQDEEMKELIEMELSELIPQSDELQEKLRIALLPKDPNDDKNILLEIRAGTGGDEAALFAADLYRMYSRYAERSGWKHELMNLNATGIGGFKEIIFSLEGDSTYGKLKFESGVHRVQRVPKTEASGRVHTSAATVAVLPEAEEADIEVNESDLKIDTYRASGAGGQHVNKTESAIRITHLPTGLVVTCQDESSQHKNRAAAMKVLRSRLLSMEQDRIANERAKERKSLVSTGDRSAKIRTYNFPQGRITDHRIKYTCHQLDLVLDGELNGIIEQLQLADQQENLKAE